MTNKPLPSFKNPPVIETVLGVEFEPIESFEPPHFGVFWTKIREDYPRFEMKSPLMSQIEDFGAPTMKPTTFIDLSEMHRCWYIGKNDQDLLQLQKNRFHWNWRKGQSEYPRYEFVRGQFEKEWARYLAFLDEVKIDRPSTIQCEITYVNHIDLGQGWNTLDDWEKIFTFAGTPRQRDFLPTPESSLAKLTYVIGDKCGRLHVDIKKAIRLSDQKDTILVTVTARGKPKTLDTAGIMEWLDLGREWIVRGFTDLTSSAMHSRWGRTQ